MAGTGAPEDDGRALLAAGGAAYGQGDVTGALRIFEDAARTTTGRIRLAAMANAASVADQLGDHERAGGWFRETLAELDSAAESLGDTTTMRATTLVNYSQVLQHLGDLDGAQEALDRAADLLTGDPEQNTVRVACLLSSTAVAIHRQDWLRGIRLATESLDTTRQFAPNLLGHPLMNLAAAYFETGRHDLAVDFAEQALAAFEAAGDPHGVAETRQNLALMHIRCGRPDDAEPPLLSSQEYFEQAGLDPRAGIGRKALGFLAEQRGDRVRSYELYRQSVELFTAAGAVLEAADARTRLATAASWLGRADEAESLLAQSFREFFDRGLGLHCAQLDFWHAGLLESALDPRRPDPELVSRALSLAIPAALALDAVRHTFAGGAQRLQWHRQIAEPAMRLAFRLAALSADAPLVADLIETQCAGSVLNISDIGDTVRPPLVLPDPPAETEGAAVYLGATLAEVAAEAGLPVAPPPRLRVGPDGHIALAHYITAAEKRYGRQIRDDRVVTS